MPIEFKTFNVMMHNDAKYTNDLARAGKVSAQKIRELNSVIERNNPHLRTILREPTTGGNTGCLVMVRYRGYWIWDKSPTARDLVDRQINRENKKHTPYQAKPDRQDPEQTSP